MAKLPQTTLRFKPKDIEDMKLYEHLVKQGNMTSYLKRLIKQDMDGNMVDHEVISKVVKSLMSVNISQVQGERIENVQPQQAPVENPGTDIDNVLDWLQGQQRR